MAAEVTLNGRYTLRRPIARGGMGEVWLARDERLARNVVVKLVHLSQDEHDADLVRRFRREAKLTAGLDHPGVPAVYDIDVHEGRPYLVMQRIQGISLADLNAEHGPLPIGWAAYVGAQVSSVLVAAHDAGMIHRDIKPANLLLDRSGSVKVLDFGLAAVVGRDDISRITRTGQSIGTPAYMAPEQIVGGASTNQTDLYGLGCTLYDLLTGQPPFEDSTSLAIMNHHLNTQPAMPRRLRAEVPEAIEEMVLAMLAKRPEDRPISAAKVHEVLVAFAHDLPHLPGVLAADTDPVRTYTTLVGRLQTTSSIHQELRPETSRRIDRADVDRFCEEAERLTSQSRFESAAKILDASIGPAIHSFGKVDEGVIRLRISYAAALHRAGQYRAAAREYRAIAEDLAERFGVDDERVLSCRLHAARAHVRLGELSRAHTQLGELLRDRLRINGAEHPAVVELRDEIAQLDLSPPPRRQSEP